MNATVYDALGGEDGVKLASRQRSAAEPQGMNACTKSCDFIIIITEIM